MRAGVIAEIGRADVTASRIAARHRIAARTEYETAVAAGRP
jgi:hypothetical protein